MKLYPGKLSILFNTVAAGKKRSRQDLIKEKIILSFLLSINDPGFLNYTGNLPESLAHSILYLSNNNENTRLNGTKQMLHSGDFVSAGDFRSQDSFLSAFFIKPFGVADITVSADLQETYYTRFEPKASYWYYILMSEHLKALNQPAIINSASGIKFTGPERIILPGNREAIAFKSPEPVTLSASPNDNPFQLVADFEEMPSKFKVIIKALPTPDLTTISSVDFTRAKKLNETYSEIFLY